MILRALTLICDGYSYADTQYVLKREFSVCPSKAALSRWVRAFPMPWLTVRDRFTDGAATPVRRHLFTHAGLPYEYRFHTAKLRLAGHFPGLVDYLRELPRTLDHTLFDRAAHCSQLRLASNPGLRHSVDIGLTRMAASALGLAPSNRRRHATVETFFLHGDRNTVAVEVPVYYYENAFGGLIAGHIDLVQVWPDKVRLLDYKPKAREENPARVVTQLSLYAHALRFRAKLPPEAIECVYFDEKDAYFFEPARIVGAGAEEVEADVEAGFRRYEPDESGSPQVKPEDEAAGCRFHTFQTYPADREVLTSDIN